MYSANFTKYFLTAGQTKAKTGKQYGNANNYVLIGSPNRVGISDRDSSATSLPKQEKGYGNVSNIPKNSFPVFKTWKGETAQDTLRVMWEVSNGDKDFILTMAAENGSFNPKLKHPNRNRDGSWDYSFGLNSYYHKPMINRILNNEASIKEIVEYHHNIYSGKEWTTSCGKKTFCGYNRRNNMKKLFIFP